jgi:hypothetical protein
VIAAARNPGLSKMNMDLNTGELVEAVFSIA